MYGEYDSNRILKTGNYVGLKFSQGWLFLNVLETEVIDLKPWILLNEDGEREEIAPFSAGSQDDEIRDEVDRRLTIPREQDRDQIFQIQVGVAEDRMQLYPIFGRNRRPNLTGGAEPGDPQVPVTGHDSPYNDPSRRGEFFNLNSIEDLSLQAFNPTSEPLEGRISLHVNKFKYAALEDMGLMRAFLQSQVPWKSHIVGLGARNSEQLDAPGWVTRRFGDVMYTSEEILEATNGNGRSVVNGSLPDVRNGGGE